MDASHRPPTTSGTTAVSVTAGPTSTEAGI